MLRLFVNTFAAYDKCSVLNREYLTQALHMQLSQKPNLFFKLLIIFLNIDELLNIFKKRMALIANVFPKFTDFQKCG